MRSTRAFRFACLIMTVCACQPNSEPNPTNQTHQTSNQEFQDCAGVINGLAKIDACGVCAGGTSAHFAQSDQDCLGICFGENRLDACGVCDEDPSNDCLCGNGIQEAKEDCEDGNKVDGDGCDAHCHIEDGWGPCILNDKEARIFYADSDGDGLGDPSKSLMHCTRPPGYVSNAEDKEPDCPTNDTDPCGICAGPGMTRFYADIDSDGFGDAQAFKEACEQPEGHVTNQDDLCPNEADQTNPGVCGCGHATQDQCGICDTDPSNDCVQDCAGTWGGTAKEDRCGTCDSDESNDCIQDCAGVWGGSAKQDICGTCDSDESNDCVQDCAGVWGGTAETDRCEVCDTDPSNDCVQDCAGVWGGIAETDRCDICDTDPSNDCVQDCAGVWGGTAETDSCAVCDSDPNNDCVQDCAGVWGGIAETDNCGTCDSDPSNDCVQDCAGVWGGDAQIDQCTLECLTDPEQIELYLSELLDGHIATCEDQTIEFRSASPDERVNPLDEIEIQFALTHNTDHAYSRIMVEVHMPESITSSPASQRVLASLEKGTTRHFDRGEFLFILTEDAPTEEQISYLISLENMDTGQTTTLEKTFYIETFVDADQDGISDSIDRCPDVFNPVQQDIDGDSVDDACDNCSRIPNGNQNNQDGDAYGDACDQDQDPMLPQNGPGAIFQESNRPPVIGAPLEIFDVRSGETRTFRVPKANDFESRPRELTYLFDRCMGPTGTECLIDDMIQNIYRRQFIFLGANVPGDYVFTYHAEDPGGLVSASQSVTIHLDFDMEFFGLPQVEDQEVHVEEESIYVGTFDVANQGMGDLEYEIRIPPFRGEVEIINQQAGTYRYQSRSGSAYCDHFEFRATDKVGQHSQSKRITLCPTQQGVLLEHEDAQQSFRLCLWGDTQAYVYAQLDDPIGYWVNKKKTAYQSQVDYALEGQCDVVLHMGDMVHYFQEGTSASQELIDDGWDKTKEVLQPLFDLGGDENEIIFSPSQGNHDDQTNYVDFVDELTNATSYFTTFSKSRTSHAIVTKIGGVEQLIVSLGCGFPEMSFLKEQVDAHPGMPTIVHSHISVHGSSIVPPPRESREWSTCPFSSPDYPAWSEEEIKQYFYETQQIYLLAGGHFVYSSAGLAEHRDPNHPLLLAEEDQSGIGSGASAPYGGDGWMMLISVDSKTGMANVAHYTHHNKVWMGAADDSTAGNYFLNWNSRGDAFKATTSHEEPDRLRGRQAPQTQGYYGSPLCNSIYLGYADHGGDNQCLHIQQGAASDQLRNRLDGQTGGRWNGFSLPEYLPAGSSEQSVAEYALPSPSTNRILRRKSTDKRASWLPVDAGFVCLWAKPRQEGNYNWFDSTREADAGVSISAFMDSWADNSITFQVGETSFTSQPTVRRDQYHHLCLGWQANESGSFDLSATVNGVDACPSEGCPVSTRALPEKITLELGQEIGINPMHEVLVVQDAQLTPERARWIIACGADDGANTQERVETYLDGALGEVLGPAGQSTCQGYEE